MIPRPDEQVCRIRYAGIHHYCGGVKGYMITPKRQEGAILNHITPENITICARLRQLSPEFIKEFGKYQEKQTQKST